MALKRSFLVVSSLALSLGFIFNTALAADDSKKSTHDKATKGEVVGKVTGIGGVFFESKKDPKAMSEWYEKNLGMHLEPWGGAILRWKEDKAEDGGCTVWHITAKGSDFYKPSQSAFMINYRVDNLSKMLARLKENKVTIVKGPEFHENGQFLWVLDPDGNKVELWEPKIWNDKNKKP